MCHTGTESSCKVLHLSCVQRRSDLVDLLVVETVIERLSRPDAVALFAQAGNEQVTESLAGAQALRRRLARVVDAAAAGEVSPAALAGSRPSWHRRSRPQRPGHGPVSPLPWSPRWPVPMRASGGRSSLSGTGGGVARRCDNQPLQRGHPPVRSRRHRCDLEDAGLLTYSVLHE